MCQGSMVCGCHMQNILQSGMLQQGMIQQLAGQMDRRIYGNQSIPLVWDEGLETIRRIMRSNGIDPDKFAFRRDVEFKLVKSPMIITGKEYLIVNSGGVSSTTTDLNEAKKRAADLAHSTQGSVYIFQPVLEIAPKRDVVETNITLGK